MSRFMSLSSTSRILAMASRGAPARPTPTGLSHSWARLKRRSLVVGFRAGGEGVPLVPGSNAGPYRIVEPLGRGGMASVFKAYEPKLERYVALKVLPREFLHDPGFAERFKREA